MDDCTRAVVLVVTVDHRVDVVVEVEREDNEVCGGAEFPILNIEMLKYRIKGRARKLINHSDRISNWKARACRNLQSLDHNQ